LESVNLRLGKLEARRASGATPHEPPPSVILLTRIMDAARRELDDQEPAKLTLTPEERIAALEGSAWFLESGAEGLRQTTTDPDHLEAIARMEAMARRDIETEGANE
jgi:hypothetical protein